jgi:hypothetical protein
LIKAVLDENMFYIQCNISHQCDCPRQLTYIIGFRFQGKDGGKEGNSKTGSCMSRRIHVSSMTVDTAIRIGLTLQRWYTFTTCHNLALLQPAVASIAIGSLWRGLLARSPKDVTCPPGMAHGTESTSPNRSPHLCRRFPRRQTPHQRYGDIDT